MPNEAAVAALPIPVKNGPAVVDVDEAEEEVVDDVVDEAVVEEAEEQVTLMAALELVVQEFAALVVEDMGEWARDDAPLIEEFCEDRDEVVLPVLPPDKR